MSQRYQSSSATLTSSYPAESQKRYARLLTQFNQEMFKRNVLTDVECIVEGQVFKAHRALLACFSPYLKKKLLNADGKPAGEKVYVPIIGSTEFEIVLRYIYSGNVEVDCMNFFEVYKAASLLQMQDLKAECLQLMCGVDTIKTYFYSYVLSKKLGVEHNWQKALKLITHRFEETVFTKEFLQLDLEYVVDILSAQSIGARSETIVFIAALNWLNKDYASRATHAVKVMECVRFSCMSMEEIVACFHPLFLPHVVRIPEVQMMLFRATCYIVAKSQGKESWFKQYANPKRNLTVENLPMELWHKESTSLITVQTDSQRTASRMPPEYRHRPEQWDAEFGLPDTLRGHIHTITESEEPPGENLERLMKAQFKTSSDPYYSGKEDSNIPAQRKDVSFHDQIFPDSLSENKIDKKSVGLHPKFPQQASVDFIRSSSKKEDSVAVKDEEYEAHRIPSTKPKSVDLGPREIEYVIPENAKIIHLLKGPLKFKEDREETAQDFLKKMPDKVETEAKKPVMTEDKKKSGIEAQIDQRKIPESSDDVLSSEGIVKNKGCILVIGGMGPSSVTKDAGGSVLIFNVSINKWMPYTNLPEPRHNHCTACIEKTLYVIGGCNSHETSQKNQYIAKRSCFKLDLENTKWLKMPAMKFARYDHAMIVYNGCLIVIGGQDENGRLLKSMESYDPNQKHWKVLNSNMCCGRKGMGAAVYADRIWIAGGLILPSKNGQMQVVSHVDCYHPEEKRWYYNSYLLPSPRCFCSLVEWNEKLYCIGGVIQKNKGNPSPTDEVWFLDDENKFWEKGPSLPEPRMGGVAVTYGEILYYLGGYDLKNTGNMPNVIFLTPEATAWSIGPPMISGIFGLSAVSFNITEETP